jgi:hypothetical protein
MWDWLRKREAMREKRAKSPSSVAIAYRREILEAERASVTSSLWTPGYFDPLAPPSEEPVLLRALDYFMNSTATTEPIDPWAMNRCLLTYLRSVGHAMFVLTVGWYEFGGNEMLKHTSQAAERAIKSRDSAHLNKMAHTWLTSDAFEIIDITMPALVGSGAGRTEVSAGSFYFRSPSVHDNIVYHPTVLIDDLKAIDFPNEQRISAGAQESWV